MDIDARTASRALDEAELRRHQVHSSGPDERRIALGWALFVLVFVPLFDLLSRPIAGSLTVVAATAGAIATRRYAKRNGVLPRDRRALAWGAWGLWYGSLIIAAGQLADSVSFSYGAAAVLGALPLLAFAAGVIPRRP